MINQIAVLARSFGADGEFVSQVRLRGFLSNALGRGYHGQDSRKALVLRLAGIELSFCHCIQPFAVVIS
jgi:hypothetical protein